MFSHSRNTVILGGTFTNVTNSAGSNVNGFQLLFEHVAQGAFHNAAERGDLPRCHPRTRIAIRAEIMEWIRAPHPMRKLILWMYGPAGSGKTAIAQSIAEECERLGILAASFFFWRSAAGRNNADHFVATLAYQLSRYIPQIENHLIAAIESDPTIFTRSLSTQMRALVIEPMKRAATSLPMPIAAIVDGVDECGPNGRAQSELLHQLGMIAEELRHLPLIFVLASRPEYEIREAFNGNRLSPLVRVLVLDNGYKPDEDIKMYLDSTFFEICKRNIQLGSRLPWGWPPASDVNFLVFKASGQFIFASTVIKFVDSPRHYPVDRLNIVLRLSRVDNENPFAPLDALYHFILGSVADIEQVLEILAFLLLADNYDPRLVGTLGDVEHLLGFDVRRALLDMHALLFVPPVTVDHFPRIYHASLSDFLMDRSRSLKYYLDKKRGQAKLARRWLKVIEFPTRYRFSTSLAITAFVHKCINLDSPANQDLVEDLARFDMTASLASLDLNSDLYALNWNDFMECVNKQGEGREDIFPRLRNDLDAFILGRIGQYPQSLQPYISILLLEFGQEDDISDILLHGASKSAEELNELRKIDDRLLKLGSACVARRNDYVVHLLNDAVRSGKYFVHPGDYTVLLKAIVDVICARPGERNYEITFKKNRNRYGYHSPMEIALWDQELRWLKYAFEKVPIDLDLANILRNRAIQFKNDIEPMPGRRKLAEESLKYLQKCGISFLEHTHQPHTNECAICTMCEGAVVVGHIPSISTELPPLPPVSELSDAVIESVLALADEFDITPYSFTHMLQFSPSSNGKLFISFTGEESPFTYLMQ